MSSEDLLKFLEAHGQQFLQSFDTPVVIGKRKDPGPSGSGRKQKKIKTGTRGDEDEEWGGIGHSSEDEKDESDYSSFSEDDYEEQGDEDEDDDFRYESHRGPSESAHKPKQPDVVVFHEVGTSTTIPKKTKSGFMSSKVTKLTQDAVQPGKKKDSSDDEDEDLTNAQNDALLHRLVHTQLLSGSLNPDLDMKPAQRKKALEGRILEAAGKAKLGKGEALVRHAERNRAAKKVRDGLLEKQQERHAKKLEEAKQLGNYHPTLKALYDAEAAELAKPKSRKREKGLKMGVGSFKDGILRLIEVEVEAGEEGEGEVVGGDLKFGHLSDWHKAC
ncbi:hypothetical protein BN946_scf185043.g127 [Trametes cinnabarina]|uniref:Uncharacterized protein n=1 Tax=Pycnoporus cinnabarinus TaxID=5643 RepID=A0A060SHT8_PYCCI|nr:hypothetical protein BN946_scf185043.g127 [Trametes cinnabarina]